MNKDILIKAGIDYDLGVSRLRGQSEAYEKILSMFLKETAFERALTAFYAGDNSGLMKAAHELKGVCGNMSMTRLYDSACTLVELLRAGTPSKAELDSAFSKFKTDYDASCEAISASMES